MNNHDHRLPHSRPTFPPERGRNLLELVERRGRGEERMECSHFRDVFRNVTMTVSRVELKQDLAGSGFSRLFRSFARRRARASRS